MPKMSSEDITNTCNDNNNNISKSYKDRSDSFDSICQRFDAAQDKYKRENGIITDLPFDPSKHVIKYEPNIQPETVKNSKKTKKERKLFEINDLMYIQ